MGEDKLFQICYEGDLTVEVCNALQRLRAEPNFDQSWRFLAPASRHAALLTRYLRFRIGGDARLLVAQAQFNRDRDYLLVRHSTTSGSDYTELHRAMDRIGTVLDLPFESTFVIQTEDKTDARLLGEGLGELCPDDSLMVMGVGSDFAWCSAVERRTFASSLEIPWSAIEIA